jgi:hypothetical protein
VVVLGVSWVTVASGLARSLASGSRVTVAVLALFFVVFLVVIFGISDLLFIAGLAERDF